MKQLMTMSGLLLTILLLAACGGSSDKDTPALEVDSQGTTSINVGTLTGQLAAIPLGDLSNAEAESIIFMREEEKLARDVYTALYNIYSLNIFTNIAASEQTHTNAVQSLIARYGLNDPMETDTPGVFINTELQFIYDTLIQSGSVSQLEALYVGALVEELDIYDLERLKEFVIDNDDILLVFDNLLKGSRNHLRSFDKQIQNNSGSYVPIYISQEQYDAIVNSPIERN